MNQTRKEIPVYMVPGASHHFWTHPVHDTDFAEIQQARRLIVNMVDSWLQDMERDLQQSSGKLWDPPSDTPALAEVRRRLGRSTYVHRS